MGAVEDEWIHFARAPRLVYLGLRVCHCSSVYVLIFIFLLFSSNYISCKYLQRFLQCRSKFSVKTADTDCSCCRGVHQSESAPQLNALCFQLYIVVCDTSVLCSCYEWIDITQFGNRKQFGAWSFGHYHVKFTFCH